MYITSRNNFYKIKQCLPVDNHEGHFSKKGNSSKKSADQLGWKKKGEREGRIFIEVAASCDCMHALKKV